MREREKIIGNFSRNSKNLKVDERAGVEKFEKLKKCQRSD